MGETAEQRYAKAVQAFKDHDREVVGFMRFLGGVFGLIVLAGIVGAFRG